MAKAGEFSAQATLEAIERVRSTARNQEMASVQQRRKQLKNLRRFIVEQEVLADWVDRRAAAF
jgi:hypothetical protein